jgi:hypothetical protein
VDRDGAVAPCFVFDRRVEPDQQRSVDRPTGGRDPVGQLCPGVGRTHSLTAGIGVIDPDNGHASDYAGRD